MESLVMRFVRAITGGENSPGDSPKLYIIIPRPHAYLADLLVKAFEGRQDVEIIADRRRGERRMQQQPPAVERRRADRRQPKDRVIQVGMGVGAPPEGRRCGVLPGRPSSAATPPVGSRHRSLS